jgi:hypothetical protein
VTSMPAQRPRCDGLIDGSVTPAMANDTADLNKGYGNRQQIVRDNEEGSHLL